MPTNIANSRAEWLTKRLELLEREKELTRLRDDISRQRRELPWVAVEKPYRFTDTNGEYELADLFGPCSQLLVYHFMFGPEWEEGCTSCSFWADNFDGVEVHLCHRDISLAVVSRASHQKLNAYRDRMGWKFRWYSSEGCDFNQDYHVSFNNQDKERQSIHYNYRDQQFFMDELPGMSVFVRDDKGQVYHTYSCYSRGLDILNGAYHLMDLTAKGRNEDKGMSWLKRHDAY